MLHTLSFDLEVLQLLPCKESADQTLYKDDLPQRPLIFPPLNERPHVPLEHQGLGIAHQFPMSAPGKEAPGLSL